MRSYDNFATYLNASDNVTNGTNLNYTFPPDGGELDACESLFRRFRYGFLVRDILCMPPTVFGNILVILAIARFPGLVKETSGILIGNLAVSDALIGLVLFPVDIGMRVSDALALNLIYGLLFKSVMYTTLGTSVLNLFLLSTERFHAIMKPLRHNVVFTKRRIYCFITFVWIFMAILGFKPLMFGRQTLEGHIFTCDTKVEADIYLKILCFIIVSSMTLNAIFFILIARVAILKTASLKRYCAASNGQRDTRAVHCCQHNTGRGRTCVKNKDIRHTWMMLIVSGLFIVLWGPFCVLSVVPIKQTDTAVMAHVWCGSLGLLNSCTNWVVYGCRSRRFRAAFKSLLKGQCSPEDRRRSST